MLLLAAAIAVLSSGDGTRAHAAEESSEVTVTGTGEFADIRVTVSQTRALLNQVVRVSWTGGRQTSPTNGQFGADYLQIMQCWGDDPAGPAREQCQFGGNYTDSRGGNWTSTRQVSYGEGLVDPRETYLAADGVHQAHVPFHAVDGTSTNEVPNRFFDQYSTNQADYARTTADGTGQEFFEVQTAREASGLGCGERLSGDEARNCWLVVVPRGAVEVDGKPIVETPFNKISSSPLSASAWANRLVVPLEMQPLGLACPLGSAERKLIGQEPVEEAVTRWQPALCSTTGTIYGFSRVSDDLTRTQLLSAQPGMVLLGRPAQRPSTVSDLLSPLYAPVSLNGLVIALNVDQRALYHAPTEVKERDGQRVESLKLNARLVAKMLTQSYRAATPASDLMPNNSLDLTRDKEFLALNPAFTQFFYGAHTDITVPLGLSDATRTLWEWVLSDPDAASFMKGKPDPYGAVLNPFYKDTELPRDDFPKSDPTCQQFYDTPPLCPLDAHAYASDMHEAARGAARGDNLSRGFYDRSSSPPAYKKTPPSLSGNRAVFAVTDLATARRYQLVTASLKSASGEFVTPGDDSLLAGLAAMKPSPTAGVLVPNPGTTRAGAYPLTMLTYAATVPQLLEPAAAADYAAFLRYAVGAGQLPGEGPGRLPAGAVPLPTALRAQALASATSIVALAGKGVPVLAPGSTEPVPSAAATVDTGAAEPTGVGGPGVNAQGEQPAQLTAGNPTPATPTADPVVLATARTPTTSPGPGRYALALVLALGSAALFAGPLLQRPATPPIRWRGRARGSA